ncbi:hypothetical protein HPP92_016158 [Vanilla planifolia]|uniref:ZF-HD dimerization-type domain-containing protein n=1 Tax=Vanilla planifolia TaxID=51239 RepID=A0A835QPR3_VANPL|nr:hypothetical protein HPP92_016158 [Vanilla planifolia]
MSAKVEQEVREQIGMPGYDSGLGNSGRSKLGEGGGVGGPDPRSGSGGRKAGGGGRYRECLKNHAVGLGGHAVDGCGEFLAAGEEGTLEGLRCAACGCHRNFHRKEIEGNGYLQHHHHQAAAAGAAHQRPMPLALPSTSGGGHGREEQEYASNVFGGIGGIGPSSSSGKKRFRTKFTQEQKDKMLAFAERVGWRIQKHDETEVQQFCNEASVKRHVFKVWMHNNKHTLGKKPGSSPPPPPLGN